MAVGPGPSYGSSEAGVLLNILIISCDMPIGLFGVGVEELDVVVAVVVGLDWRGCGPVRDLADDVLVCGDVDLADVCGPAGARVGGPVGALEEGFGEALGKKLSDVLTIGEKRILLLASLHDSFSSFSSSEL